MGLPNNNRHEVIDPTKNGNKQDLSTILVTLIVKPESGKLKGNYA